MQGTYKVELAPSGRAKCQGCKELIEKVWGEWSCRAVPLAHP